MKPRFALLVIVAVLGICHSAFRAPRSALAATVQPGPLLTMITGGAADYGCSPFTNSMTVNSLVSFGNTSNFTHYATPSITPSSNALLVLSVTLNDKRTVTSVTNSGANPMTWWKVSGTNFNTLATATNDLSVWVTQVPPGTNPPAMQVWAISGNTSGGGHVHLTEFVGAQNLGDWGTNAIVQSVTVASNATANGNVTISAPGMGGSNAVFVAFGDDLNSASNSAAGSGMTELTETAIATQNSGHSRYYRLMAPSSLTALTNITTSRDWAAIALEIRVGTNCVPNYPPTIVTQPVDLLIYTNQTRSVFSLSVTGSVPLAFQWQTNSVAATPVRWGLNTTSNLWITNSTPAESNLLVRCIVTNLYGSVTSSAVTLLVTNSLPPSGGPFTLATSTNNSSSAAASTITATVTGVSAGQLVVVFAKYEAADGTITVTDGSSTWGSSTRVSYSGGGGASQMYYTLASAASGNVTYTATFGIGATAAYRSILVYVFDYTGTCVLDTSNQAEGSATSMASGSITTSSDTYHVLVAGYGEATADTVSARQISGINVSGFHAGTAAFTEQWYRISSTPSEAGGATGTLSGADPWAMHVIAFKTQ